MSVGEAVQQAGTIVAAIIGVVGLGAVLYAEGRRRYTERLDDALADLMKASSQRAINLTEYQQTPVIGKVWNIFTREFNPTETQREDSIGGPPDFDLQAKADIAWMTSRRRHRTAVQSIADAAFNMKRARVSWQIASLGQFSTDIRRWRTREISRSKLIAAMLDFQTAAVASGEDLSERQRTVLQSQTQGTDE